MDKTITAEATEDEEEEDAEQQQHCRNISKCFTSNRCCWCPFSMGTVHLSNEMEIPSIHGHGMSSCLLGSAELWLSKWKSMVSALCFLSFSLARNDLPQRIANSMHFCCFVLHLLQNDSWPYSYFTVNQFTGPISVLLLAEECSVSRRTPEKERRLFSLAFFTAVTTLLRSAAINRRKDGH